jgi:hypothetical protein
MLLIVPLINYALTSSHTCCLCIYILRSYPRVGNKKIEDFVRSKTKRHAQTLGGALAFLHLAFFSLFEVTKIDQKVKGLTLTSFSTFEKPFQ